MKEIKFRGNKPFRANPNDAGADLVSAEKDTVTVTPGRVVTFDTGTAVDIPEGYVGLVFSRSGLGSRGFRIRNGVGVIDPGYKKNILATMENASRSATLHIEPGDRIAQLVIVPMVTPEFTEVAAKKWDEGERDGFGSTGVA